MATIEEALALAFQHHRAGRLAEADEVCRRILDVSPDHAEAIHMRGVVAFRNGDAAGAAALIGRAVEHAPHLVQGWLNLANILKSQGQPADAVEPQRRVVALDPGNPGHAIELANLLTAVGRHGEAAAAFTRVLLLVPDNAGVITGLARVLMPLNRLVQVEGLLRRARRLAPGDMDVAAELGRVLEALRVWDEAGDCLAAVAAARPQDTALALRAGIALRNANRDDEAAGLFRTLAAGAGAGAGAGADDKAAGDARADAACQLGLIERQAGRLAEAEAAFRAALARHPWHALAHFHLGLTLRLMGRDGEAFADPHGLAGQHAVRAGELAAAGRLKDACAHYLESLLFAPGDEAVRTALRAVLAERQRRCDAGGMADKEHTDEWGNVALYIAMDTYNRTLAALPRLAGVPAQALNEARSSDAAQASDKAPPAGPPRVFDGFTIYNELDLLELRLEELADSVDAVIAVEAPWTFQGKPKPLILKENLARFRRFGDRLVHVVVDGPMPGPSAWDREGAQRNAIMQGLAGLARPQDVVFIGDVDEIPRRATVMAIRNDPVLASRLNRLSMDYCCGFLDFRCNFRWHKSMSLPYALLQALGPDHARFLAIAKYGALLYDTGWHFSWLGGIDKAIAKLAAYAHSEYTGLAGEDPERIREALRSGRGIFGLMDESHGYGGEFQVAPLDDRAPTPVRADPERFRRLGWFYESIGLKSRGSNGTS
jgi:tetratricopeptide (TPR) repeat protein